MVRAGDRGVDPHRVGVRRQRLVVLLVMFEDAPKQVLRPGIVCE